MQQSALFRYPGEVNNYPETKKGCLTVASPIAVTSVVDKKSHLSIITGVIGAISLAYPVTTCEGHGTTLWAAIVVAVGEDTAPSPAVVHVGYTLFVVFAGVATGFD